MVVLVVIGVVVVVVIGMVVVGLKSKEIYLYFEKDMTLIICLYQK